MNTRRFISVWSCFITLATGATFAHESDEHQSEKPSSRRPRVLLIGDSISMGYTPFVKQMLENEADVQRPKANCGPTTRGLARLDDWLGDGHWDVIHFNFGLHDLKYIAQGTGQLVEVDKGQQQVPIDKYVANLQTLANRLKETNATLIWCTTTPVPEGAKGRVPGDSNKYNAAALHALHQVLGEDLLVDDLFAFSQPKLAEIQQPANVHFSKAGSEKLARQVVASIRGAIQDAFETAQGTVFEDTNQNGTFDEGEKPLAGIRVSNGQEIVKTDDQGRYELPVSSDAVVFVIKPRGYRTPLNKHQLPQFYYIHKPEGSPSTRFAGVRPTGPLPEAINFPLIPQREPNRFKAIMFGDPQPRNQKEVDFIAHDVVEQLIGTDASFGVTLGDITFDNLDLFEPQARAIAVLGIPWYNVIGNHDLNYDAPNDDLSDESFERVFGPTYYSFDYGPVHFLVLDDVEWLVDANGKGRYQGGLGRRQMEFIRRDLSLIPDDQLVILMMHIPLEGVRDRQELFRLIEKRPFSMSISAHTHTHVHRYITKEDGWMGPEPHHHVINVTVSGGWWSGQLDERGIPHTLMSDGAPNGYSVIEFDGQKYSIQFKPAGRPADYQIAIHAPEVVKASGQETIEVFANVFNGSSKSKVRLQVNGQAFEMQQVVAPDPKFVKVRSAEELQRERLTAQGVPKSELWTRMPSPGRSFHLWRLKLPVSSLSPGVNRLSVEADLNLNDNSVDGDSQTVSGNRLIRLEE